MSMIEVMVAVVRTKKSFLAAPKETMVGGRSDRPPWLQVCVRGVGLRVCVCVCVDVGEVVANVRGVGSCGGTVGWFYPDFLGSLFGFAASIVEGGGGRTGEEEVERKRWQTLL